MDYLGSVVSGMYTKIGQHCPRHMVFKKCVFKVLSIPLMVGVLFVASGWGPHSGSRTFSPWLLEPFPKDSVLGQALYLHYEMSSLLYGWSI